VRAIGPNEREEAGNHAPGNHDPGDPKPRAETMQRQIGGHLQKEITNEKEAGAKAIGGLAQAKRRIHLQLGETNVRPVNEGDEVAGDQKRNQPPHNFADGPVLDLGHDFLPRYSKAVQRSLRGRLPIDLAPSSRVSLYSSSGRWLRSRTGRSRAGGVVVVAVGGLSRMASENRSLSR